MEKPQKHYTLYKRKNGVYYVRFRLKDGTRTQGTSTGETAKARADRWAIDYLQKTKGYIIENSKITLIDYSKDFFDFNGRWATNLKVEGERISESHCRDRADTMRLHVLPALGHYCLEDLDKHIIKSFRNELHGKGFSGSLVNKCLYALKTILTDAEDRGIIRAVPTVKRASDRPAREKGILSVDEMRELFSITWMTKPSYSHPARPLTMGQTGNMVAASTGMRLSEIQALQIENLHLEDGYLIVEKGWNNRLSQLNTTTKTGRGRLVNVPSKTRAALLVMLRDHPAPKNPGSFVFWAEKTPGKPAEKEVFTRALHRGLEMIGIPESERKRRNVTLHSWRHFYNTYLINKKVPIPTIQKDSGHVTAVMTERNYYHGDDRKLITDALETMF
jgi:integrase